MDVRCAIILSLLGLMGGSWGASFSESRNQTSPPEDNVTPAPNIQSILKNFHKDPEESSVDPNVVNPPSGVPFSGQGVSAGYSSGYRGAPPAAPVVIPPDAGLPPPIPGIAPGVAIPPGAGYGPGLGLGGLPGLGLGGLPGLGLGLPGLGLGGLPFGAPLDAGIGPGIGLPYPGIGGGLTVGGYFPIIKKVIMVGGLGLLFLLMAVLLKGALAGAGLFESIGSDWGFGGIGGSISKDAYLDASINTPMGSAGVHKNADVELANKVHNAINSQF